ncbi:MAG TPA: 50S ribosomal protein L15e [Candidatus Nanoarchaeia archaeon]|nr:50S ribosomal protein L15e [Candidatus Nanoarchaeia archaeon]
MGYAKYLKQLYQDKPEEIIKILRKKAIEWRKSNAVVRIERPTRLDRARALGYKAKKGYIAVRVRLLRSKRQRPMIRKGRRSKHKRRKEIIGKSYQWIAEERANDRYVNCEVLGSYLLFKDGKNIFFEIILGEREILKTYPGMEWITDNVGRVYRGLTSAGRKSRGLLGKGKGHEKNRPSLRAHQRRGKN